MGTWNDPQKGFTVNERLPDAIVDFSGFNVFINVARLYQQTLKKAALSNFGELRATICSL
ncbi:hypothetical protein LFYK43_21660 [Ligilactobacillus salitolerans]|uniref:Uncharacterized protein n=1 Tax=Ligilactobacillus salitolerans TaxID=1808352 RepID=A0A401IW40_9LACO|nr:hypothetical protein [Ligilactobacillus salitolerans]GBG95707.1 hypothetical protein LFYK43_21660 [Ligilactobacillus salitolerans]